jgi:hypothetical protein
MGLRRMDLHLRKNEASNHLLSEQPTGRLPQLAALPGQKLQTRLSQQKDNFADHELCGSVAAHDSRSVVQGGARCW